jgi:hypothetical protein
MAKKTTQPAPEAGEELTDDAQATEEGGEDASPRTLAAELEAARLRAKLEVAEQRIRELEAPEPEDDDGPYVNARRLTNHQDIERFFRLGRLHPKDVARFRAEGQLPPELFKGKSAEEASA